MSTLAGWPRPCCWCQEAGPGTPATERVPALGSPAALELLWGAEQVSGSLAWKPCLLLSPMLCGGPRAPSTASHRSGPGGGWKVEQLALLGLVHTGHWPSCVRSDASCTLNADLHSCMEGLMWLRLLSCGWSSGLGQALLPTAGLCVSLDPHGERNKLSDELLCMKKSCFPANN